MRKQLQQTSTVGTGTEVNRSTGTAGRFAVITVIAAAFISGAAGLGYELVWTRMFALGLGAETPSVLAVLAAFFGGSALGAWILDKPISASRSPARWYALLESVICVWAVVLAFMLPSISSATAARIGGAPSPLRQWSLSFILPFACLLPATLAMGGTMVAVERILSSLRGSVSTSLVYAVNTAGAVIGAAAAAFVAFPLLGFSHSLLVFGGASALCAGAGLQMARYGRLQVRAAGEHEITASAEDASSGAVYGLLFLTGLLGVGYEVLMMRALSQVLENTAYSFTSVVMVYLFGTAAGAWLRRSRILRSDNFRTVLMLAASAMAGTLLLRLTRLAYYLGWGAVHGSLPLMIGVEVTVAAIALLLPAAASGFAFCHFSQQVYRSTGGFGKALAVNTAGGTIAPVLFGVLLLPAAGLKTVLVVVACAYLAAALIPNLTRLTMLGIAAAALGTVGWLLTPGTGLFTTISGTEHILAAIDGKLGTCTVVEGPDGGRHLLYNSRFSEGGTTSPLADGREAAIPLLMHPSPRTALFLGVGAGITLATAHWFDSVKVDGVELIPEMKTLLPYFLGDTAAASVSVVSADARRFAATSSKRYDVIVGELYHPARDGAGQLYTVEHFRAIRGLLDENGIFCQWLPLYQMNSATLRTITRTFAAVFPRVSLCMAYYSIEQPIVGLVGSDMPLAIGSRRIESLYSRPAMHRRLEMLRFYSSAALAGCILGSGDAVRAFAGEGPVNTDDVPRVMFDAPSYVYGAGYQQPDSVVSELVAAFETRTAVIDTADTFSATVALYRQARDRFLRMGITALRSSMRHGMELHLDSLLACARLCPDFEAAYNPLVGMAMSIAEDNAGKAHRILSELATLNPRRAEAAELLRHL